MDTPKPQNDSNGSPAVIGIDLGTTNCLCSVWRNGVCELIPNRHGEYSTPSAVSLLETGEIVVGKMAKERMVTHPQASAATWKQHMGTRRQYQLDSRVFYPEELSSFLLRSLKEDAVRHLGQEIKEAIVTVPAYFNDAQRTATKAAAKLAGLPVDRIINEPSAAALAYRQDGQSEGTGIVFDFGGGTLDISVVEAFDNIVDILAVSGDNHLGGCDIDQAILAEFFSLHPALPPLLDEKEHAILLKMAEQCKTTLTTQAAAFMVFQHGGQNYTMELTNAKLVTICAPLLARFRQAMNRALADAQMPVGQLENIILVGGSCRMPLVQQYIEHITSIAPSHDIDPEHAVAVGAGLAAAIKSRSHDIRDMVLTDICPFSLGVRTKDEKDKESIFSPIITRNSALPVSRERTYCTAHNRQKHIVFDIYQGESLNPENNLLLGKMEVAVPPLPKHEASVKVRFTYDINGILEVEAECVQSGKKWRKLIVNNKNLEPEELERRLVELQVWKLPEREKEENQLVIARAERLYEECSVDMRNRLADRVQDFKWQLDNAGPAQIARTRSRFSLYLDSLEKFRTQFFSTGMEEDTSLFTAYYEEEDTEDEEWQQEDTQA